MAVLSRLATQESDSESSRESPESPPAAGLAAGESESGGEFVCQPRPGPVSPLGPTRGQLAADGLSMRTSHTSQTGEVARFS